MGLNIVKYPSAQVNGNPSQLSKWNAVHHKIGFNYQRKDLAVYSCTYASGQLTVQTNGAAWEGVVGDSVYINSGVHKGVGVVSAIVYAGTPYSIVRLNWSSIVTATQIGGFVNFNSYRKNYNAITNILAVDSFGAYYVLGESINKPDYTGLVQVDVSVYLKALITDRDNFGYDVINWKEKEMGDKFNITFSENWTGTVGTFCGISGTNLYYFVNATKQIQQKYGSNVGDFVPFRNFGTSDVRAKFMSDFENPTYFPGFPFSLGFIYSDSMDGYAAKRYENTLDNAKATIASTNDTLDSSQQQGVNRLMLKGSYPADAKFVDVWINSNNGLIATVGMGSIAEGYVATGYFLVPSTGLPIVVTPSISIGGR